MTLVYPEVLFLLFGVPLLILMQFREYLLNRRDFTKIGGFWENKNLRSVFFIKWFLSSLFIILAYIFFTLSLAGLTWGKETIEEDRSGLDIVFLVDVSYSMLAEDIAPSRIGRAKEVIRGLAENSHGARFCLVAFRGDGTVLLPATEDIYALENALAYINTGVISTPGTNIEAALKTAINVLPYSSNRHRVIVLFSDGEQLSGNYADPAIVAGRRGIPIYIYGLGTKEGTTVRLSDNSVIRDLQGNPVITRLDSRTLEDIAQLSRGQYFDAIRGLSLLDAEINRMVDRRATDGFRLVSISRYRFFLGLGLLCYLTYILIRQVKLRGLF